MNKFKLIKTTVSAVLISASLAACGKTMDCNIASNHVHFYENEDTKVIKLIEGEKEKRMGYNWTDNYVFTNNETKSICDNDLCYVSQNTEYLENEMSKCIPYREVYQYGYRYGSYYGYGYRYTYSASGKYEYTYSYGLETGYHWDYDWDKIDMNEHTSDKVRDTTYKYKLYKIESNGEVSSIIVDNIEDIPSEYKYFKPNDFVVTCVSEPYYLKQPVK